MAIDSSLFICDIPAQAYSVGDIIPLKCVRGPEVIRSGYGSALLKRITVGRMGEADSVVFDVHIRNSNWIDDVISVAPPAQLTSFDENSTQVQDGHNCPMQVNSSWYIYAKCIFAGTVASASSIFALIDIDYPSVANVADPRAEQGFPTSIELDMTTVANSVGSLSGGVGVSTVNVDILKAGYRYLLSDVYVRAPSNGSVAFLSISGAAGQNGLERIIPIFTTNSAALRFPVTYATPLVKGPFNINLITTGGASAAFVQFDWVKR